MFITVEKDEQAFDKAAAARIIAQIKNKPDSVIGLSTGRTTGNMHRLVSEAYAREGFDCSHITLFGVDEVGGVPKEYSGACYTMLKTQITDNLGLVEPDNFIMLPTMSDDFERDCKAFRDELAARGGVDLMILGLGENGHLGFNQPGTPFESRAGINKMLSDLEERIRRETGTPEGQWLGGITLGLKDIMEMKRIVLVAKGSNKTAIVKEMLEGPVTEDVPASMLQNHPCCEFLLDSAAAAALTL